MTWRGRIVVDRTASRAARTGDGRWWRAGRGYFWIIEAGQLNMCGNGTSLNGIYICISLYIV